MCGCTSWTPFATYDPDSWCWRTWLLSDGEGAVSTAYSQTWPKRGMTRTGVAYAPGTSVRPTAENDCSLLPTPCASDGARGASDPRVRRRRGRQLRVSDVLCHPPHAPAYARTRTAHTTTRSRNPGRLLPTPLASDASKGSPNQRDSRGNPTLPSAVISTTNGNDDPWPRTHRCRSRTHGASTNPRSGAGRGCSAERHRRPPRPAPEDNPG